MMQEWVYLKMNRINGLTILPSILAADFSKMGEEVSAAVEGGADGLHIDVMDGRFVPPITFGIQMIKDIKPYMKEVPMEVHLMVHEPITMIPELSDIGVDSVIVHLEACLDLEDTLLAIRSHGMKSGVAVKPDTEIDELESVLDRLDIVLAMTVEPGYGGQAYIASVEPKIKRIRSLIEERDLHTQLEVDGGINESTIKLAYLAGATRFVCGSAIFGPSKNVKTQITKLRQVLDSS